MHGTSGALVSPHEYVTGSCSMGGGKGVGGGGGGGGRNCSGEPLSVLIKQCMDSERQIFLSHQCSTWNPQCGHVWDQ